MLMSGAAKPWVRAKNSEPILYCISMVRNEADIIRIFLAQALSLFDKTFIVDIQSTDGTKELIESVAADADGRIVQFTCRTQERYQAALMNALARKAFAEGADWVFPLDADEFVDVESREALAEPAPNDRRRPCLYALDQSDPLAIRRLRSVSGGPDIFLSAAAVVRQQGRDLGAIRPRPSGLLHRGRQSQRQPDVRRSPADRPSGVSPPASSDPLGGASQVPMINAQRLLDSKHNTGSDEGFHIQPSFDGSDAEANDPEADDVAGPDLRPQGRRDRCGLAQCRLRRRRPRRRQPWSSANCRPSSRGAPSPAGPARSLKETLERDVQTQWEPARFGGGAPVGAEIAGSDIAIRCLPLDGEGHAVYGRYEALGAERRAIRRARTSRS